MKSPASTYNELFYQFQDSLFRMDPVYFCAKYLKVDGKPLDLVGTGYKPFQDIYRYIGISAIEKNSKPIVMVKGRQVGATTMAAALECYFIGCGRFGTHGRSPMRMMHLFPTLSLAAAYTKDKLDPMIGQAAPVPGTLKKNGLPKSFMENIFDSGSPANDSMHFKKFMHGNQIWIESTGLDGDRIRGRMLNLETELPTPDQGFVKLKDLKEGDKLFDENGNVCNVTKLHPIDENPESYRITFDDGTIIEACAEHLWFINNLSLVKNTKFIFEHKDETLILQSFLPKNFNIENIPVKQSTFSIKDIVKIDPLPMRCITVDSPSHLYLVTRSYIPTHNTIDCAMFDECFPHDQLIDTNIGKIKIGKVIDLFNNNKAPLINTYNENTGIFEYKSITNAWNRGKRKVIQVQLNNRKIKCTPNHPFLTTKGWVKAKDLVPGNIVLTSSITDNVAGTISVTSVTLLNKEVDVYDIEVKDNHNFIACFARNVKNNTGVIVHNCQDMTDLAIGAATKVLAKANYGSTGQGLQVYFGTPKTKGGSYWEMWQNSSQQYFHLRCEKCGSYFPLYRPDTNWEDVWIYGMTVRCTDCAHEQDKNEAVERGKWIPLNNPDECDFVGYHFNQLYIPTFTRETVIKAKPDRSPINTERVYMNEVLGEFYDGEGGTITTEQIRTKCIDKNRKMVKYIHTDAGKRVYAGFDWGQRGALEQLSGRGGKKGSYSCAVILTVQDNLFNVEFCTRLMKADPETKEGSVEEMFRRYNMTLAVGDIGDAYDLTHRMQRTYDERFLASRSQHKVIGHVKYMSDIWPKTIIFEKDYYIGELLGLLKEGRIKFPGGHYHKIEWLIEHCASMDIKVTKDKSGEPLKKYVKGSGANDGLMALLNAYLAWKFDVTQGFTIANPLHMKYEIATEASPVQAIIGYIPRMNGHR